MSIDYKLSKHGFLETNIFILNSLSSNPIKTVKTHVPSNALREIKCSKRCQAKSNLCHDVDGALNWAFLSGRRKGV